MPVVNGASGSERGRDRGPWFWRAGLLLAPVFAVLVGIIVRGKATSATADPLPWLVGHPVLSTAVGLVYVAAHLWLFVAVVSVGRKAGRIFPSIRQVRASLSAGESVLLALVFSLVVIEHFPRGIWRALWRAIG
jgi:hypothetical protein